MIQKKQMFQNRSDITNQEIKRKQLSNSEILSSTKESVFFNDNDEFSGKREMGNKEDGKFSAKKMKNL